MLQRDEAVSHLFIANVNVPATTMYLFDSDELASILGERAEYCIMCGHGGACMRLSLGNADATSLVTSLLQLLRPNTRRRESAAVSAAFRLRIAMPQAQTGRQRWPSTCARLHKQSRKSQQLNG